MPSNLNRSIAWLCTPRQVLGLGPKFTQADILRLAPGLTATTLQNWANRDLVRPVILTGRRLYDTVQLQKVVLGHQLVEDLRLQPAEAIVIVLAAYLALSQALKAEGTSIWRCPDELLKQYWVIRPKGRERDDVVAVKEPLIAETLTRLGASIILPHGRNLIDLAERAMALKQEAAR